MRILLVEDDESIREVLKLILETDPPFPGMLVDAAANGAEALAAVKANRPDAVLLDLTLPEEHGFEVFKKLRALPGCNSLPVLAVTAHSGRVFEQDALALGFAGYVSKPIDFENSLFPQLRKIVAHLPEARSTSSHVA